MQERAYPTSHERLIFSTMMVGITDNDAIAVRILHRLDHTAIPIDLHDLDKFAPRIVAMEAAETFPPAAARPSFSKRSVAGDRGVARRRVTRKACDTRIACVPFGVHTLDEWAIITVSR